MLTRAAGDGCSVCRRCMGSAAASVAMICVGCVTGPAARSGLRPTGLFPAPIYQSGQGAARRFTAGQAVALLAVVWGRRAAWE